MEEMPTDEGRPGLSRTAYDQSGASVRVELSLEERIELQRILRATHRAEMRECLEDARELGVSGCDVPRVACALFERRAPAGFSIYQEALARKAELVAAGPEELLAECSDCGDELSERSRKRGFAKCFSCFRKSKVARAA